MSIFRDTEWVVDADCLSTDPEVFFPAPGTHTSKAAKRICAGCPVKAECLEFALSYERGDRTGVSRSYVVNGVYGGYTARERERLLGKKRNAA